MIKKLLFTCAALLLSIITFANPVSKDLAKTVATNFYKYINNGVNDYSISNSYEAQYNGMHTFYTFVFTSGGFVMVAADDAAKPILGYSTEGTIDFTNVPVNTQEFFDDFSKEIYKIVDAKLDNTETLIEWNKYATENSVKSPMAIVGPFCLTTWDQ